DPGALLLILGGTVGSFLVICPFSAMRETLAVTMRTLRPVKKPHGLLKQIVELAYTARREGVLALEGGEQKLGDPTLKKGLELLLESADPATLRGILERDSAVMAEKERSAQELMERLAVFSPGIGMVGTLVEIAGMLGQFRAVQTLAPQIAHALLPVVYGAVFSYLLLFPLAARIKSNAARSRAVREMATEGVLAIQAGEPPRLVEERLEAFVR
ncbi:MAG: MotA/TolQ/ExbB proton channel family protein, partial [Clostridia bacterium]|nr:MotA/TolQ/ExbB proton channel family protein [Clostridia bacterium]